MSGKQVDGCMIGVYDGGLRGGMHGALPMLVYSCFVNVCGIACPSNL